MQSISRVRCQQLAIDDATTTYLSRYRQLIDVRYNHIIYDSFIPEHMRKVITRWRLSNHRLRIETGRQETVFVKRHLRVCFRCHVLEDEEHVIFKCPIYDTLRETYSEYLERYPMIDKIFNPISCEDAVTLGKMLIDIDGRRDLLGLN